MSATPPNPPATTPGQAPISYERTEADWDAVFASVVWLRTRCPPEVKEKYLGMYVAILGEGIIDADRDEDELVRRLEARGAGLPLLRVAIQYLQTVEDSLRYQ